MAVVISFPFVVLVFIVANLANIRSVKIIPVIISPPINISLGVTIIITPIRVPCCIKSRPGANDQ